MLHLHLSKVICGCFMFLYTYSVSCCIPAGCLYYVTFLSWHLALFFIYLPVCLYWFCEWLFSLVREKRGGGVICSQSAERNEYEWCRENKKRDTERLPQSITTLSYPVACPDYQLPISALSKWFQKLSKYRHLTVRESWLCSAGCGHQGVLFQ